MHRALLPAERPNQMMNLKPLESPNIVFAKYAVDCNRLSNLHPNFSFFIYLLVYVYIDNPNLLHLGIGCIIVIVGKTEHQPFHSATHNAKHAKKVHA